MTEKKIALVMGALFAGMSVALGAFAAHGLRAHLSLYELSIFLKIICFLIEYFSSLIFY